jgi:hypothetical protein
MTLPLSPKELEKQINFSEQFQSVSRVNDELIYRLRPNFSFPRCKKTTPPPLKGS